MKESLEWSRFQSRRCDHVLDVLRAARKRVWEGTENSCPGGAILPPFPQETQIQFGYITRKLTMQSRISKKDKDRQKDSESKSGVIAKACGVVEGRIR